MVFAALASSLALLAGSVADPLLDAPPPSSTPETTAPAAPAKAEAALPAGAPEDDYGFIGWCYGALSAHLDLYEAVLPEVKRIETAFPDPGSNIDKIMAGYADQHSRGAKLLARYGKALEAEEAKGATGGVSRTDAIARGKEIWTGSDTADKRQLAQLWMSWGLPGRCDAVARRVTIVKAKH
jgi:hypothetical protein